MIGEAAILPQTHMTAWAKPTRSPGRKTAAIKNYEKSVELNPNNKNGVEMLKKLKGE